MDEDEKIKEEALRWVKEHKHDLIERFASFTEHDSDPIPTTIFMAGSPGAGKTEVSMRIIEAKKAVRIDADEIRKMCPRYAGHNAHLFQPAVSKGVHILFEHVLKHKLNAVVDGTFVHAQALPNIKHSIEHKRRTEILFVYQDPLTAWDFTKKREVIEGRKITKVRFIESFFQSQQNVLEAMSVYGQHIELNLLIKDFKTGLEDLRLDVKEIDPYLPKKYHREDLERLLV
jgi:UDP-N-acetylglucosamine kinase